MSAITPVCEHQDGRDGGFTPGLCGRWLLQHGLKTKDPFRSIGASLQKGSDESDELAHVRKIYVQFFTVKKVTERSWACSSTRHVFSLNPSATPRSDNTQIPSRCSRKSVCSSKGVNAGSRRENRSLKILYVSGAECSALEEGYSFVARLSLLTIGHASRSRRSTTGGRRLRLSCEGVGNRASCCRRSVQDFCRG